MRARRATGLRFASVNFFLSYLVLYLFIAGLYRCAKFCFRNPCTTFNNTKLWMFCVFDLKTPIHAHKWGFRGVWQWLPKWEQYQRDPQKIHPSMETRNTMHLYRSSKSIHGFRLRDPNNKSSPKSFWKSASLPLTWENALTWIIDSRLRRESIIQVRAFLVVWK